MRKEGRDSLCHRPLVFGGSLLPWSPKSTCWLEPVGQKFNFWISVNCQKRPQPTPTHPQVPVSWNQEVELIPDIIQKKTLTATTTTTTNKKEKKRAERATRREPFMPPPEGKGGPPSSLPWNSKMGSYFGQLPRLHRKFLCVRSTTTPLFRKYSSLSTENVKPNFSVWKRILASQVSHAKMHSVTFFHVPSILFVSKATDGFKMKDKRKVYLFIR